MPSGFGYAVAGWPGAVARPVVGPAHPPAAPGLLAVAVGGRVDGFCFQRPSARAGLRTRTCSLMGRSVLGLLSLLFCFVRLFTCFFLFYFTQLFLVFKFTSLFIFLGK